MILILRELDCKATNPCNSKIVFLGASNKCISDITVMEKRGSVKKYCVKIRLTLKARFKLQLSSNMNSVCPLEVWLLAF